ncbi:MAG: hypothetical protein A2144_02945 [Chloroflexi bacterium RBG_16_50_9]|nr:MAG: hypothetical protein A2144_02945 [Chloroflexi bacterium RBG_16_50_9]
MAKSEQDRIIDEWVTKRNKRIGEIRIPQLGEYPPDIHNLYGSILNEWVTTDLIRHYADSVGDRNPLWRNQEYARGTRWGGIVAPPTFTNSILQGGPMNFELEQFRKFNTWTYHPVGNRRELLQMIRPGDRMRAIQRYLGLEEVATTLQKPTRHFVETVRRTLINQREETVAVIDTYNNFILNHPAEDTYGLKRKKYRLTDKEQKAIYRGYDEEERRGADTLFWEDVSIGEEIKLHPIGPLAAFDSAAWCTAESGHAVAFEVEWERIKLNFDFAWLDPEVNAWTCAGVCHLCDDKGHATKFTGGPAVGFPSQLDGLIGRMICNWMGDDGLVKMLNTRTLALPIVGELLYTKGRVVDKSSKDGEYLVDLEVHCDNQDGLGLMSGSATIKLPSRTDFGV